MEKKVTICLGSMEGAEEFVKSIKELDCEFEIPLGKSALEAKCVEDIRGLDLSVPHPLYINGEKEAVERAVKTVNVFLV